MRRHGRHLFTFCCALSLLLFGVLAIAWLSSFAVTPGIESGDTLRGGWSLSLQWHETVVWTTLSPARPTNLPAPKLRSAPVYARESPFCDYYVFDGLTTG